MKNWNRIGDTSGMSGITAPGRTKRFIPEFVANEGQFKSVLVHATVGYIFRNNKFPQAIAKDLEHLKQMANDRAAQQKALIDGSENTRWNQMQEHIRAVQTSGGHMQMTAAIMYRAWKLGWHGSEIAAEMGMKESAVISVLTKLKRIAEKLGYPTYPPPKRKLGRHYKRKTNMKTPKRRAYQAAYMRNLRLQKFIKTIAWG